MAIILRRRAIEQRWRRYLALAAAAGFVGGWLMQVAQAQYTNAAITARRYGLTRSAAIREIPPQSISSTGRMAGARVAIPLPTGARARDIQVVPRQLGMHEAPVAVVTNINSAPHVSVSTNGIYVIKDSQPAQELKLSKEPAFLPDELAMYLSDQESVHGRVYLVQDSAMRCYPTGYATTISVGLGSTNSIEMASRLLSEPLPVKFRSEHLTLRPKDALISKPGVGGEVAIEVTSTRYYGDEPITARWDWGREQRHAQLKLHAEKLDVLGFMDLFCPPVVFGTTIAGGALGGVLRVRNSGRRKRSQWYWLIFEGGLTAVFLLALLVLGLLAPLGLSPTLKAGVPIGLVLGILGGLYGTKLIDCWTKNVIGAAQKDKAKQPVPDSGG